MGHVIDRFGIHSKEVQLRPKREMPTPANVHDVRVYKIV